MSFWGFFLEEQSHLFTVFTGAILNEIASNTHPIWFVFIHLKYLALASRKHWQQKKLISHDMGMVGKKNR